MIIKATELGLRDTACEIAALLTQRDLLRRIEGVPEVDIRTGLDVLRGTTLRQDVDREALRRAKAEVTSVSSSRWPIPTGSLSGGRDRWGALLRKLTETPRIGGASDA